MAKKPFKVKSSSSEHFERSYLERGMGNSRVIAGGELCAVCHNKTVQNMKNKTSLFLVIFVASLFVVPQITFAAWWNPISWKIFNRKSEIKTEQRTIATSTPKSIPSKTESSIDTSENKINTPSGQSSVKNSQKSKSSADLSTERSGSSAKNNQTQTIKKTESEGEQYDRPIPITSVKFDNAVIKSVLRLKIYDTVLKQDILWGSGISIGGLGNILTNYHVVEKAITDPARYQVYGCVTTSLNTQCDNFKYFLSTGAKGSKYNKNFDLALVYIDQVYFDNKWSSVLNIPLNALGDHTVNLSSYTNNIKDIYVDYPIYSIGYPDYGGGKTVQAEGVVQELFTDQDSGQKLILNSIDISHGNSGGPVFNSKGELVGVTVACLVASPDNEKCKTNSGLFIPLPTVNWWYTKMTNSEIVTWEGRQSYLKQSDISWQSVLCSLRQNAYYDPSISADSCICKSGYTKNSNGDCLDGAGINNNPLIEYGDARYGEDPDTEAEQRALKSLTDMLDNLGGSSSGPLPSSEQQTNDQTCVKNLGPNRVWDGNKKRISCPCKEGTLYFPNEILPNPYEPGHYYIDRCIDPKTITSPVKCSGNFCEYK